MKRSSSVIFLPMLTAGLLVLVFLAAGCTPVPATPSIKAADTPSAPITPPTPTPTIPADAAELGTVTGYLKQDKGGAQPVGNTLLGLAEILNNDQGTPTLAGFDRKAAPRTITDGQGHFTFLYVKPGKYALILDRVYEAFMLTSPADGSDLIIEVKTAQTSDLGELIYKELPGQDPNQK